ncbi:hst3 protein [Phlyctema vagabunda]|uniref:Hst3 protein n=1 Tax=Phlyctema vagabunda TaxID=108571 RepID=A0ABR4P3C5_9HELO
MPTINVKPGSALDLQAIADVMGKSKKVVVITGAGISTNCGIPDFRSENGLYSLIQAQYDAAARDPSAYTEDVDTRPTKRRRVSERWTYVTVAEETGEVITEPDLVAPYSQPSRGSSSELSAPPSILSSDAELSDGSPPTPRRLRRSQRSQSSNTDECSTHTSYKSLAKVSPTSLTTTRSNHSSTTNPAPSTGPVVKSYNKPTPSRHASLQRQRSTRSTSSLSNAVREEVQDSQELAQTPSSLQATPAVDFTNTTINLTKPLHEQSQDLEDASQVSTPVQGTELAHTAIITQSLQPPTANLLQTLSSKFASDKALCSPQRFHATTTESVSTPTPSIPTAQSQNARRSIADLDKTHTSADSQIIETQPSRKASLLRQSSSILSSTEEPSSQSFSSSQSSSRASLPNLKGKDLFDSMIWSDAFTTSVFYRFISSLRQKVKEDVQRTTQTHRFIRILRDGGRLVRCYTQNIDSLEEREGLSTQLELGPGDRSRFSKAKKLAQSSSKGSSKGMASGPGSLRGGVEVVQLHGSLVGLRCGICGSISSWDEDRHQATSAGQAPECPSCESKNASRTGRGRRSLTVGRLRPDIVLYGEEHPSAHLISPLITHDLSLGPDVLLILGTSLRVHGLKVMVREFAKSVHNKGGKVVFVNNTKPSESVWGDVIDYWVEWDCDAWVSDLMERREDISAPQDATKRSISKTEKNTRATKEDSTAKSTKKSAKNSEKSSKNGEPRKVSRPSATRDCRLNGVYFTFKIIESLGKILDKQGQPSPRGRSELPSISRGHVTNTSRQTKNARSNKRTTAIGQRPSQLQDQSTEQSTRSVALSNSVTEKLLLESRNLSPEDTRQAILALSAKGKRTLPTTYGEFFSYTLSSNVLPGLTWPTASMNLLTHPPNTTGAPQLQSFQHHGHPLVKVARLNGRTQDSSRLDLQRIKSLKELGLRPEVGNGSRRVRGELRSRRPSLELPPISTQVETRASLRKVLRDTHEDSVVKVTRSCAECKRRKIRCDPSHQTYDESSLPVVKGHVMDSHDITQLSELSSTSSTPSDLQDSVDAQLLSEASALTRAPSNSACSDCKRQKKRCSPLHRPLLPTPSSSYASSEANPANDNSKLPTPPISSDPVTVALDLTPITRRIKDMGHIGAVLSSPLKPTTRSSRRLTRGESLS